MFAYDDFAVTPAFSYTPFALSDLGGVYPGGVFRYNPYNLTREYHYTNYKMLTPITFNSTNFTLPDHISRYYFNRLYTYNAHWFVQRWFKCEATCAARWCRLTSG